MGNRRGETAPLDSVDSNTPLGGWGRALQIKFDHGFVGVAHGNPGRSALLFSVSVL